MNMKDVYNADNVHLFVTSLHLWTVQALTHTMASASAHQTGAV
jgi:hypothetical protein